MSDISKNSTELHVYSRLREMSRLSLWVAIVPWTTSPLVQAVSDKLAVITGYQAHPAKVMVDYFKYSQYLDKAKNII